MVKVGATVAKYLKGIGDILEIGKVAVTNNGYSFFKRGYVPVSGRPIVPLEACDIGDPLGEGVGKSVVRRRC